MFADLPVMKLSTPITEWPCASSRSVRCDPRKPAAPVLQIETAQQIRRPRHGIVARQASELEHRQRHVFLRGEFLQQVMELKDETDLCIAQQGKLGVV